MAWYCQQKALFKDSLNKEIRKTDAWNIGAGLTPCFDENRPVSVRQKTPRLFDQWMDIHSKH